MKRSVKILLTVALLAVMVCSLTVPALAAKSAPDDAAQSFMDLLDEEEISYTYEGKDSEGDDHVSIIYDDDGGYGDLELNFYFSSEYPEIYLYVWYIVDVGVSEEEAVKVINELNLDYRYCKLCLDTSDMTVTDVMYCYYVNEEDAGEIACKMLYDTLGVLTNEELQEALLGLE